MRRELLTYQDPKSPVSEVFRTLRTNIQFMNTNRKLKTLLVTSTFPEEGKSWITSNLAVTFAQAGKRVILVDADMRKGRQYNIFGVLPKPGLSNYLSNMDAENNEISNVNIANYIQATDVPNLHILTAGNVPPNPSELLVSHRMRDLLQDLKNMCDLVIIDGTPCDLVTDALILSRIVDSTIVVAAQKQTKKDALVRVVKNIQNVGGRIAGVVLNKVDISTKKYNQAYYYGSIGGGNLPAKSKKSKKEKAKMDGFFSNMIKNSSKDVEFEVPDYEKEEHNKKEETNNTEAVEQPATSEDVVINNEYSNEEQISTNNVETVKETIAGFDTNNIEQPQQNYEEYKVEESQPSYEEYKAEEPQQSYEEYKVEQSQPSYEEYKTEEPQQSYEEYKVEQSQPSYEEYKTEEPQQSYEEYKSYKTEQPNQSYEEYKYDEYKVEPQQEYESYKVEQHQPEYDVYKNENNYETQIEKNDIIPNISKQLEDDDYNSIEQREKEEYRKIKEQIDNNNRNFKKNKKKNRNKIHFNEHRNYNDYYKNEIDNNHNNKGYREIEAKVQEEGKISEVKIEQNMDDKTKEILRQVNEYIEAEKHRQGAKY